MTKSKVNLTGFRIMPVGQTIIFLKKSGRKFNIKRAETSIHNYIIGTMYVWHQGDIICENLNTKEKAILNMEPKGWTSQEDYLTKGSIVNRKGEEIYKLEGRWDESLEAVNLRTHQKYELGNVGKLNRNIETYCFT